jgi:hypothetical protein
MIIVQLKGGLGNQLFQYAAGLSLAAHHNVPLKVDISELRAPDEEIGTLRQFELQHLIDSPVIASEQEIADFTDQNLFDKYYQKLLPSYKRKIYNEKQFKYDPNFFKSGSNIYVKGYRQSEQYFRSIEKEVREKFRFKPALLNKVADFGDQLKDTQSVSIHIRRGDYTDAALQSYHGLINKAYYQKAIEKMSTKLTNPAFFVFSDNIHWVKENLILPSSAKFVSGNISHTHYEDFYLMSCCQHNIIANSSFSWWAAWLNPNPNKIVIAPQKWFEGADLDMSDLIPSQWLRL